MSFTNFFHNTSSLDEAFDAIDSMANIHNLTDFFNQPNKSPYMLLQILAIALTPSEQFPAITMDELNAKPTILLDNNTRKKMHFLMTKTRFSNDFNTVFRNVFPDATGNPVEWAKKNREISTNIQSPEIQKILSTVVNHYTNVDAAGQSTT